MLSVYFAHLVAVTFDLPTLITIAVCSKVKSFAKAFLCMVIIALIGELGVAITNPAYEPSYVFLLRIAVQIFFGCMAYNVAMKIRQHKQSTLATTGNVSEAINMEVPMVNQRPWYDAIRIDSFFHDMQRLLSFKLTWAERTTLEKSYTAIFAIMLIAVLPLPYALYDIVRVVVCVGLYFYFLAILPERKSRWGWFALIIGLFFLYNPIEPVHIGEKGAWAIINAMTLVALYRARMIFDKKPEEIIGQRIQSEIPTNL